MPRGSSRAPRSRSAFWRGNDMLIVQFTDTHVLEEGKRVYGRFDSHAMLERAIDAIVAPTPGSAPITMPIKLERTILTPWRI